VAGDERCDGHPVADADARGAWAELRDDARELVPEDERVEVGRAAEDARDVRAADPGRADGDENLAGAGGGGGALFVAEVARTVENGG
jgi:hypothetical protein